jgi:hypothetical protein
VVLDELLDQIGGARALGAIERRIASLTRLLGSKRAGTVAFWALVTSPAVATLAYVALR